MEAHLLGYQGRFSSGESEATYVRRDSPLRQGAVRPSRGLQVQECLPGQRAAAEQWFSHFCAVRERLGFEAFKGIPSVLRRRVRPVVVSVHVDDELIAEKVNKLQRFFKLTIEGPFPSLWMKELWCLLQCGVCFKEARDKGLGARRNEFCWRAR